MFFSILLPPSLFPFFLSRIFLQVPFLSKFPPSYSQLSSFSCTNKSSVSCFVSSGSIIILAWHVAGFSPHLPIYLCKECQSLILSIGLCFSFVIGLCFFVYLGVCFFCTLQCNIVFMFFVICLKFYMSYLFVLSIFDIWWMFWDGDLGIQLSVHITFVGKLQSMESVSCRKYDSQSIIHLLILMNLWILTLRFQSDFILKSESII